MKKHKSKGEKKKKKAEKKRKQWLQSAQMQSEERDPAETPSCQDSPEEKAPGSNQGVPASTPSSIVRDEWMTKPKEGWLSGGTRPGRPQTEEAVARKEPRPEVGLYVPNASASRVSEIKSVVGDGGASWRLRALRRMKERSQMEKRSLEEIAEERGMDLDRLQREAAQSAATRPRKRFHRPKRHSYLDDVQSERGQMQKPQTDRSSFTKRRVDYRETKEREDSMAPTGNSAAMNKFPNDGSFLSMFSDKDQTGETDVKGDEVQSAKEPGVSLSVQGNASVAEQLREQLNSGKSLQRPTAPRRDPDERTMPHHQRDRLQALDAFGKRGSSKKRRDLDEGADITTLYKRARSGKDTTDMDAALAKNIASRQRFNVREDLNADMEYDFGTGTDLFEKKKRKNHKETLSDLQRRERRKQLQAKEHMQKLEDRCLYCFNGTRIPKHLVISIATTAYLRLPEKGALDAKHCYIVPMEHLPSTREVDEDAWTEIRNFKKAFIQMNAAQGRDVIFMETSMYVRDHGRHAFVECVPVKHNVFEKAPMYFKKAIDDATSDWSQHHSKRCIETGVKGLRGSIPEHFPYFHVEFNLSKGFVHVIDDEANFDPNLGRRVLIGLLNRPAEDMYKREDQQSIEEQKQIVNLFVKDWHPFDWTVNL